MHPNRNAADNFHRHWFSLTVFFLMLGFFAINALGSPIMSDRYHLPLRRTVPAIRTYNWSLSAGTLNYSYKEGDLMSINGHMTSIQGSFTGDFDSMGPMYFTADLQYASGGTSYDGATLAEDSSGNIHATPKTSGSKDGFLNARALFGGHVFNDFNSQVNLYGGLAYWRLKNRISGDGGYDRAIDYIYLPVGFGLKYKITRRLQVYGNADYNVFLTGASDSKLSQVGSNYQDMNFKLYSGRGYRITAGAAFDMGGWSLSVEPYYWTWDVDISEYEFQGSKVWFEPANKTRMTGVNVSANF